MDKSEVLALLKASRHQDSLILLDDGEFYIEHSLHFQLDEGKGDLWLRCPVSAECPGGYDWMGCYEELATGRWQASISVEPELDRYAWRLGVFGSRDEAIATLWLFRHRAYMAGS